MDARGVAAPVVGALTGFLISDHKGLPLVVVLALITFSLGFGMLSAVGRALPREREQSKRFAMMNAGALWVICAALVFKIDTDITGACLIALGVGLAGGRALEVVEGMVLRVLGSAPPLQAPEGPHYATLPPEPPPPAIRDALERLNDP